VHRGHNFDVSSRCIRLLFGFGDHPKTSVARAGYFNSLSAWETDFPVAVLMQRLIGNLLRSIIISSAMRHVEKTASSALSGRGDDDCHGVEIYERARTADGRG
jgi:hypothetical protein